MKALGGTRLCPTQDWRFWLTGALCGSRHIKDRNLVPNIEEGATDEARLPGGEKCISAESIKEKERRRRRI